MSSKSSSGMSNKQPSTASLESLARAYRAAPSETDDAIKSFLSSLNCPRSLAVWLLYSNMEHRQLVDLECHAYNYADAYQFKNAYFATEFLSKSSFLKLDTDRKAVAFEKFLKYENLCKHTNNRFLNLALDPQYNGVNVTLLSAVRRKISHILGDISGDEWFEHANWGPGVTTLLKGEHVSSANKFHSENGITRDLYSLVGPLLHVAYPLWSKHLYRHSGDESAFDFQVGNSVVTVPKNAKTDRVIAVEPGMNLFFQKSIGNMIRRRLLRAGINLNTQVENQRLALKGSISNSLATVDFSSASDSIARRVVENLLPPRWYAIMNSARSVVGTLNKDVIRWEKFSSMGNGFTFELESLIFFAAASAVAEHLGVDGAEIYVHGDDVILPSSCCELFSSFSAFLGFTVNTEKTHINSPFRESCGSHYYKGSDCKPIYLKDRLRNVESFYKLANGIRMLSHRCNFNYGCDIRFHHCWVNLYRRVPKPLRFGIPYGIGDSGFVVNFDEATPARAKHGIEGFRVTGMVNPGVTQEFEGEGLLLASLWAISGRSEGVTPLARVQPNKWYHPTPREVPTEHKNTYTLRGRTKLKVNNRLLVLQWYNLGPWS